MFLRTNVYRDKGVAMNFTIRNAYEEDLEGIVEAYNTSIPSRNSTCDITPISAESRLGWLRSATKSRPIWVAIDEAVNDAPVMGYLSLSNFMNSRPGYSIAADIGLYVHSKHHRKGVGKTLMKHALDYAPSVGIETLVTTIFASNEASMHLFQSLGFEQWGYMPRVARLEGTERDLIIVGLRLVD